jgi:hypothetical protein
MESKKRIFYYLLVNRLISTHYCAGSEVFFMRRSRRVCRLNSRAAGMLLRSRHETAQAIGEKPETLPVALRCGGTTFSCASHRQPPAKSGRQRVRFRAVATISRASQLETFYLFACRDQLRRYSNLLSGSAHV